MVILHCSKFSYLHWLVLWLLVLIVFSVLVKTLAGNSIFEITCFVSSGNQSINHFDVYKCIVKVVITQKCGRKMKMHTKPIILH